MKVMGALKPDSLTISHKKGALRAINLIKEKQSRKLKMRTCADGRPQRWYTTKEDASLSTISLEDFFTSLIIYAHKGIEVAIFDVPGAYFNDDMQKINLFYQRLRENLWTSCARWTLSTRKCTCGEWSKGNIPTSYKSLIYINGVWNTVVWSILKYPKIIGVPDQ